eukprot:Plantae.Rhodophyta-Rhodochaete_pulchella.ctg346.p1 GENE.Plantae.Rhodophyta-Rhodochaete_pulchella.ctg346~~Plantae.Rhodophyta-Rhodochaete_pulchella.ctg346.p1  ORF type:complete len:1806 (-),score=204.04 Plantae.Rhodophyta-Rhodochaete_pulchella.ctg346:877-5754(-)
MVKQLLLQYRIWRLTEKEVQEHLWRRVLLCWASERNAVELQLPIPSSRVRHVVRNCVDINDIADEVPFVPQIVRPTLYQVCTEAVLVYGGSNYPEQCDRAAQALVSLLIPAASHFPKEESCEIAEEVLSVLCRHTVKHDSGLVAAVASTGPIAMSSLVCLFWSHVKAVQQRAIKLAFFISRHMKSPQTETVVAAASTAALVHAGADTGAHQLASELAFGNEEHSIMPFRSAIPMTFALAAVDDDIPSRVTVLRALENELSSETNASNVLGFPPWPIWTFKALHVDQNIPERDENSCRAFSEARSRLLRTLLRAVYNLPPLSDYQVHLSMLGSTGTLQFQREVLMTMLYIMQEECFPVVSESVTDSKTSEQVDKLSVLMSVVEVFLFCRVRSLDEELARSAIDTVRVLGVWRAEHAVTDVTSYKCQSSRADLSDETVDEDVSSETCPGGILRTTLRILCFLLADCIDVSRSKSYVDLLVTAVAPPNGQVLSVVWLTYVKRNLEAHISKWKFSESNGKADMLIRALAAVEAQWIKVQYRLRRANSANERDFTGMDSAESVVSMILQREEWTFEFVKSTDGRLLELQNRIGSDESDMLDKAAKAREWALEGVARGVAATDSRTAKATSIFQTLFRERNAQWKQLKHEIEWEAASDALTDAEFWKLDSYSDELNRRWLLRRNPEGSDHSDAALETGPSNSSSSEPKVGHNSSADSESISSLLQVHSRSKSITCIDLDDLVDSDEEEEDKRMSGADALADSSDRESGNLGHTENKSQREEQSVPITSRAFTPLLSSSDAVWSNAAQLVKPLSLTSGQLEITRGSLVFRPHSASDVIPPSSPWTNMRRTSLKDRVYALQDIREVQFRRYLLRPVAVEIFFTDRRSAFFSLETEGRNRNFIKTLDTQLRRGGFHNVKVYKTARNCQIAAKEAREAWRKGLLSNFEYIMTINKLAGRSYNDISQYPVFPWIICDYGSSELDLEDPRTFRDLSKPMGCQPGENEVIPEDGVSERERYFRERYRSWSDPRGVPPFHFGSHYSSAGTVLHFLVRMEPFSSLFIQLQGGHFDYADRMFRSVKGAWISATTSTQNVNELTPEFFYNPEFMKNRNRLPLGVTQERHVIDDVELPPWAKRSPERFVRLHREALESDYVSTHLHHWIDLIFGFKQRGPPAVDACNVFYYLTYEKAVDLDSIADESLRRGTEAQITHFGQTPLQLFPGKPHPSREPPSSIASKTHKPRGLEALFDTDSSVAGDPVVWIVNAGDTILTVARSRSLGVHRWNPFPDLQGNPFTFEADVKVAGSDPGSAKRKSTGRGRRLGGAHVAPGLTEQKLGLLFAATADGRFVISGGHWDGTVRCSIISEPGRPRQILSYHRDVVTCVGLSSDGFVLATGSRDASVLMWDIAWKGADRSPLVNPTLGVSSLAAVGSGVGPTFPTGLLPSHYKIVSSRPRLILAGHIDPVTVVAVSVEIGYVLSADEGGRVLIHSIRDGRLIRASHGKYVTRALPTVLGHIIYYSDHSRTLRVETVNGGLVAEQRVDVRVSAMQATKDGRLLVTGHESDGVSVRTTWDLKEVQRYELKSSAVSALSLTADEGVIFVGLRSGQLQALTLDRHLIRQNASMEGLRGPLPVWYSS